MAIKHKDTFNFTRTACVLLLAMAAVACAADTGQEHAVVGGVSVALTNVPTGIQCVRVDVQGAARSESRDFTVAAGASTAQLTMQGLPVGSVNVTVFAFGTDCASIPSSSAYDWFSDPVTAVIPRNSIAQVAVSMKRNGRSTLSVDFPDAEVASGNTSQCPVVGNAFRDDFNSSTLDPNWTVWQYSGQRNNNQSSPANHFTLASGALHYVVDPMTEFASDIDYAPHYDGQYYWYDPGLELSRPLTGSKWTLDIGVDWYVPLVVNAAGLGIQVHFGSPGTAGINCSLQRYSNDDTGQGVQSNSNIISAGCWSGQNWMMQAPLNPHIVRYVRFERANDQITISLSNDGITWQSLLTSDPLPAAMLCAPQNVLLSGTAWFNPSGSYADYDYVSFTP